MRILLVSDLHYSLPQLDWLVAHCATFDLVVVAGDCLNVASPVPLDAQAVVVLEYLSLVGSATRLVVGSGNHDLTGPDAAGEQSALWLSAARAAGIPTDGDSVEIGDTRVTVCPWWDGPVGRTEVEAQLDRDSRGRPARWIWVYHWPPLGSPTCWTGRKDYGDPDVLAWIEEYRPEVVLAGHVHQAAFIEDGSWADRIGGTWVFNAGHQIGTVPARVELELDHGTGSARWVSMMGDEHCRLDDLTAPARTVF
jgi:Icc-related predicted phosphoesterase